MEVEEVDAEIAAWAEHTKQCNKKEDDGKDYGEYPEKKEEYPEKEKETKKAPKKEKESYEEESSSEEGEEVGVCCSKRGGCSACLTALPVQAKAAQKRLE
jgi:hypothetical protein